MRKSKEIYLLILSLLLAILIYLPAMGGDFVFDDHGLIPQNPVVHLEHLSWSEIGPLFSLSRPAAMLSLALNYYLHGLAVAGYHLFNLLIHLLSGITLYFFIRVTLEQRTGPETRNFRWVPFWTALIWLVHPVQTQTVSYIIQRMTGMATLFYLLSLLFYVLARTNDHRWKRILLWAASSTSAILALASKEIAVTLPLIMVLYEWFFFQDLSPKYLIKALTYMAFLCVGVGLLLGAIPSLFNWGIISHGYVNLPFSMVQRVMTEWRVVLFYITLLVLPHPSRLNLDHQFLISLSPFNPPATMIAGCLLLAWMGVAIVIARHERLLSFCIIWFFMNLAIESTVLPLDLIFEHRLYLPSTMAVLFGVLLFQRLTKRHFRVAFVLMGLVVLLFSIWTFQRNQLWASPRDLYLDAAFKSPMKKRPAYNAACEYARNGKKREALYWLKQVQQRPVGLPVTYLVHTDPHLENIRSTKAFKKMFPRTWRRKAPKQDAAATP